MITWAPHIPLIGGFPLGAEKALGTKPEFIASLNGFYGNDCHYVNYQNNILKRNLEYKPYDSEDFAFERKINIVVGTPPCSALSSLNSGRTEESSGAKCKKNDFMYIVAEQSIRKFDADVILIENAPALFTTKGLGVAQRLKDIAQQYDRSLTLYKTSTHFHGIPQRRDRTFAIIWNSKTAPIMDWFNKSSKTFPNYLKEIPTNALHQNININDQLLEDHSYRFLITKMTSKELRDSMNSDNTRTAFYYVRTRGMLDEMYAYFDNLRDEKAIKYLDHAKKKFEDDLSIWDASVNTYGDVMNACVGRALFNTIHPSIDRSLTIREAMHMMGLPNDFELLGGSKNINHIAQNVPTCTAADMVSQAKMFLEGKLKLSNSNTIRQNNWKKTITDFDGNELRSNSLEGFLE